MCMYLTLPHDKLEYWDMSQLLRIHVRKKNLEIKIDTRWNPPVRMSSVAAVHTPLATAVGGLKTAFTKSILKRKKS